MMQIPNGITPVNHNQSLANPPQKQEEPPKSYFGAFIQNMLGLVNLSSAPE